MRAYDVRSFKGLVEMMTGQQSPSNNTDSKNSTGQITFFKNFANFKCTLKHTIFHITLYIVKRKNSFLLYCEELF